MGPGHKLRCARVRGARALAFNSSNDGRPRQRPTTATDGLEEEMLCHGHSSNGKGLKRKNPPRLWGRGGRLICRLANYVRTGPPIHKQQQVADFVPISRTVPSASPRCKKKNNTDPDGAVFPGFRDKTAQRNLSVSMQIPSTVDDRRDSGSSMTVCVLMPTTVCSWYRDFERVVIE